MDFLQLIPEQLILLVFAVYILGEGFKRSQINNKYIPLVLLVFSSVFSSLIMGLSATSILQGILCWGTAIGINQTFKQLQHK